MTVSTMATSSTMAATSASWLFLRELESGRCRSDHGEWAARAACKGRTREFYRHRCQAKCYASHGQACHGSYTVRAALAVCEGCPVLMECRAWALSTMEQYGISGGLTEAQRASAIDVKRRVLPKLTMVADMRKRSA